METEVPETSVATDGVHPGLKLVSDDVLGTVLVTTQSYRQGEPVLCEAPLVVVSSPWGLKEHLRTADAYVHDAVMAMCFSPVLGPKKKELKRDAGSALTLGAILASNGHAFNPPPGVKSECDLIALYHLGSKAQHSCAPNCAYRNVSGRLFYTALADIPAGSVVTFSYCLDWTELMMPTCMRRELIRERRGFDCACERCELGEDALRRRRCHLCGEVALGPAEPRLERAASLCRSCGARGGAEGGEDEVLLARQAAKLRVSSGADAAVQLHARCMEQLGETHWATARCCCMLLLALAEQSAEAEADAARARSLYSSFQKFLRACELTEAVPNLHHILTIHLWQSGLLDVQVCRDILPLYQAIHGRNPTAVGIADALGKSMSPIQRLKCSDGYFAQLALLLRSRMPGSSGMVLGGCATAFAIGLAVAVHARRSAPAYSLPRLGGQKGGPTAALPLSGIASAAAAAE